MPFKQSKQVLGLIIHYGDWTRYDEDIFYERVRFDGWRGSSGIVPRSSILNKVEIQRISLDEKGD